MKRIFISSVQKEFADERRLLKRYISKNPAYKRLFDTFVFEEDVVATDRRTDQVYLDELGRCDIDVTSILGSLATSTARRTRRAYLRPSASMTKPQDWA